MASIGFVVHGERDEAMVLAKETAEWLSGLGHRADIVATESDPADQPPAADLDLLVSVGGDGTMLRAVHHVCQNQVPVLGVNFGNLGYLTVVEPGGLRQALERFLAGDYRVESRMTIDVAIDSPGGGAPQVARSALNDVVFQRTAVGHTMRTEVAINGAPFLTYASDSLILATPTGSTAYNLSARGPIVSPTARVQVLTPVAPHMLFDRALVLDATETVSITPAGGQPVDVVVDGWHAATVEPGRAVHCLSGQRDARLVTFEERDFQRILKSKFDLRDR